MYFRRKRWDRNAINISYPLDEIVSYRSYWSRRMQVTWIGQPCWYDRITPVKAGSERSCSPEHLEITRLAKVAFKTPGRSFIQRKQNSAELSLEILTAQGSSKHLTICIPSTKSGMLLFHNGTCACVRDNIIKSSCLKTIWTLPGDGAFDESLMFMSWQLILGTVNYILFGLQPATGHNETVCMSNPEPMKYWEHVHFYPLVKYPE